MTRNHHICSVPNKLQNKIIGLRLIKFTDYSNIFSNHFQLTNSPTDLGIVRFGVKYYITYKFYNFKA